MSYRERNIIHESPNHKAWVLSEPKRKRYTVFRTGTVVSTSDSSYAMTADGLSIAIARADYLDKRATNAAI